MSAYPPKLAQRFLVRLVPSGIVGESIVGDAHEEYLEQIARVGSMRARLWYWSHVLNIALKYRNRRTTESAGHGRSRTALAGLAQDCTRLGYRGHLRQAPGSASAPPN